MEVLRWVLEILCFVILDRGTDLMNVLFIKTIKVEMPWETIFSDNYTLPSLASWENWKLILGYGSTLFMTQFTETAIALNVVDRLDGSQGPGFLVLIGQGIANVVSGLLGGMGGSGVVSMSVLADRTFGTTCLSTFITGLMMFIFVTWGYPVIDFIPLSAISGISVTMVCSFVQWRSMAATLTTCLPNRKRNLLPPQYNVARLDVIIMLLVTAACLIVDVATLLFFVMALGIFAYTTACIFLARRREQVVMDVDEEYNDEFVDSEDLVGEEFPSADKSKTRSVIRPQDNHEFTSHCEDLEEPQMSALTDEEMTLQKKRTKENDHFLYNPCSGSCGILPAAQRQG